jgi:sRNA-binding regulator protein Hfq
MNRKLIRPNLTEVKTREIQSGGAKSRVLHNDEATTPMTTANRPPVVTTTTGFGDGDSLAPSGAKPRRVPPVETNAEIFYYKKQIDAHTPMVIVLTDGEEIKGTIEWYDRQALKINRRNAPNILLLKHNIKYMYKAEDAAV